MAALIKGGDHEAFLSGGPGGGCHWETRDFSVGGAGLDRPLIPAIPPTQNGIQLVSCLSMWCSVGNDDPFSLFLSPF